MTRTNRETENPNLSKRNSLWHRIRTSRKMVFFVIICLIIQMFAFGAAASTVETGSETAFHQSNQVGFEDGGSPEPITSFASEEYNQSSVTSSSAEITIEATTTESNAPANALADGGQPIDLSIDYSGLGDGTHTLTLKEGDPIDDDTIFSIDVDGGSGSKTIRVSESQLLETKEIAELAAQLYIKWGSVESNRLNLVWSPTTIYTKGYGKLSEVEEGKTVTITYYGWTSENTVNAYLFEDDPLLNDNGLGNDEQIRWKTVTPSGSYFEGTFTFTPSEYIGDEPDNALEVQARPESDSKYGPYAWPDLVREIQVVPEQNEPPSASITASPDSATVGETISFDGSASVDSDGSITAYEWDFDNDGTVDATGETAKHSFDAAGEYTVSLTVTDDDGMTNTAKRTVSVDTTDNGITATRTIDSTTVPNGSTVQVTVTIETDTGEEPFLTENFDPAFANVEEIEVTPAAGISGPNNDNTEYVAGFTGADATTYEAVYEVTIPDTAEDGDTFEITGTADDVDVTGHSTIKVGEAGPVEKYDANDDGEIQAPELGTAFIDWQAGDLPAEDLLTLFEAWQTN